MTIRDYEVYLNRFWKEEEKELLHSAYGVTMITQQDKEYLRHGFGSWLKNNCFEEFMKGALSYEGWRLNYLTYEMIEDKRNRVHEEWHIRNKAV